MFSRSVLPRSLDFFMMFCAAIFILFTIRYDLFVKGYFSTLLKSIHLEMSVKFVVLLVKVINMDCLTER